MSRPPHFLDGQRMSWWARLRWRLGLKPWERCPGQHIVRNIYGDEIIAARYMRSHCINCSKRWPSLWRDSNEVGYVLNPESRGTDR